MSQLFTAKWLPLAIIPQIGPTELVILVVVVLLIFGPKNLPKLGKALGKGMREFKDASRDLKRMVEMEDEEPSERYTKTYKPPTESTTEVEEKPATTENSAEEKKKKSDVEEDDEDNDY